MEFRILGPLEVANDAGAVAIGGPLPRALLAMLLLHANQPVPVGRLAGALWGDDAPAGAGRTLQVYVSRLRKALGERDRLVIGPAGYLVRVLPGELDAERFDQQVAEGHGALASGELERGALELRQGLSLWRGPALAELASVWLAPAELARLEERRLVAVEARVEAELGLGQQAELVAELQTLVTEHPWRERLHAQLMLALYRAGRQADALEAYRSAREVLVEQLGIEPASELQDLQRAVLAQDPGLDAPTDARDAGPRRSLPVLPNRTIGRERELSALVKQLQRCRLVTLTGPGGVGKTRLALETGRLVEPEFAHGVQVVSLAPLQRPDDVPAAIVDALDVTLLSGESPGQAVRRFLAAKHLLLVVDNCEHVLGAAHFIGGVLESCPGLTVLATSREPLAIQAEHRYPVPALADGPALALFSERAQARDPEFSLEDGNQLAVIEICRRVDGLPLAIELAAARCGLLSASEIAEHLDSALAMPATRDAPPRQQTLRATIEWSHGLLNDEERRCFAAFAVFAGGATIEAAEAITAGGLETLDGLVMKSLLTRRQRGPAMTRLGMLATIRAYAGERLTCAADVEAVHEDHYRYYLALVQRHGTDRALRGADAAQHLASLDAEVDNLHAALGWAVAQSSAYRALAMVAALGRYWIMRDRHAEALDWIEQTLSLPRADAHPALGVRALCTRTSCLWRVGRGAEEPAVMAAAEAMARRLGDPLSLCRVLQIRVHNAMNAERLDVADALADEALHWATVAGDDWEIAEASGAKAIAAASIAALRERVDRAAALLADAGNRHQLAILLSDAAYSALCLGSERDAMDLAARATPITRALDNQYVRMLNSGNLGLAALLIGATDTALHAFREQLTLCRELVILPQAFEGLRGLAAIAALNGDGQRVAILVGAADAHRYGAPTDPVEARLDAEFFESTRTRYGSDAWNAAAREGSAMSFEDAIAYGLEEPPG